ncbi:MAG: diaminopimelate decarboxylase [Anaerolineaceae bacterium]|nr:diaminopimelate decarboxylase [Anaerolineaceae bacterium]
MLKLFPITTRRDPKGRMTIAGQSLRELVQQYGSPLYLYDGATLRSQLALLRKAFEAEYRGGFEITYAAKAYFSLEMAKRMASMGLGVDVVSLGELKIAGKAGFSPKRVHFHGNNKTVPELLFAMEWGISDIVVDNLSELVLLEFLASEKKKIINIWLRITPGVKVETHQYWQTGDIASKFGLPINDGQASEGIRFAQSSRWLKLRGLHTHVGSQVFDTQPYAEALRRLIGLAEQEEFILAELSPGGGLGVQYLLDDKMADAVDWVQTMSAALEHECGKRGWPLPKLLLEPGRWLVGQAGVAVYSVGAVKFSSDGMYIVAVDGGMADNPRPAMYQAHYVAALADRLPSGVLKRASLVGKYCESGDQLIPELKLPEVYRGELIAMPVAGAYQLSMSSNYNMASRPAVLWLEEGRAEVMQRRENPDERGWWVNDSAQD